MHEAKWLLEAHFGAVVAEYRASLGRGLDNPVVLLLDLQDPDVQEFGRVNGLIPPEGRAVSILGLGRGDAAEFLGQWSVGGRSLGEELDPDPAVAVVSGGVLLAYLSPDDESD